MLYVPADKFTISAKEEPMKVLHVSSEAVPYAKTGGLADVVGALPTELSALGMDVKIVLPRYGSIPVETCKRLPEPLGVPLGPIQEWGAVWSGTDQGSVPVYFLEHEIFFDRPHLYGPPQDAYGDNLVRFAFLSRGALQLCHALQWYPDIIHVHDWQTALIPVYLNSVEEMSALHNTASVLTIHNMDYQGNFPSDHMPLTGLGWEYFNYRELEFFDRVSLLKGGIVHATEVSTVSKTYGEEICSAPLGRGLEDVLNERSRSVYGILNGIDYELWNPSTDDCISRHYDEGHLQGKRRCKRDLQREFGLEERANVPLYGIVSRFAWQKGIDVLSNALERMMELDIQFCLLGSGDPWAERFFGDMTSRWPGRAASLIGYNDSLARKIYAGSDFFLMPSRYEPCGLGQLIALRYGSIPVVRATGGLKDTIEPFDEETLHGTGFVFNDLNPSALYDVVGWATWAYYNKKTAIKNMRTRGMKQRFHWSDAAKQYADLYERAIENRRKDVGK